MMTTEVVGQACFYNGYLGARDYISRLEMFMSNADDSLVNMAASGLALFG